MAAGAVIEKGQSLADMGMRGQRAAVTASAYYLPERMLTNEELIRDHPTWSVEKIHRKTGITTRHVAAPDETALDLGVEAARKLFQSGVCCPEDVDLLVFCTQTPDYVLPTSACIMQDRLGLPTTCAAFDFNLGCSGFVYGLSIIKGMLEAGQARKALLVTGDTYTKWLDHGDWTVRTIFGDGAAATLVEALDVDADGAPIGPFLFGTDGRGYDRLIVHGSGARPLDDAARRQIPEGRDPTRLYMDGAQILTFTVRTIPPFFKELLAKADTDIDDLDLVVFHQANRFMLDHLRKRCHVPEEKFVSAMASCGNTVASSIPIAMKDCVDKGILTKDMKVAIVGFGVGYSWAGGMIVWKGGPPSHPGP